MSDAPFRDDIRRIVIKLGTNTLCNPDGTPDPQLLEAIAREVHQLRSHGKQVLVVSSGAIGLGQGVLGLVEPPRDVKVRQACAALGQFRLMSAWQKALGRHGIAAAQVLLTHHTFDSRRAYLHLRECLEELLARGALPIINENDTVSIAEIDASFGDNDRLGAIVAAKVEADLYVILSDVDGLYNKPPHLKTAKRVPRVEQITDEVMAMAGGRAGKGSRGGMGSKLESARFLTEAGVPVVIAYGRHEGVLGEILAAEEPPEGRIGTWFDAAGHRRGTERWLLSAHAHGAIDVDAGAAKALREGYHLLPAGVTEVVGDFPVETVIDIRHDRETIARAVSQLSSADLRACRGLKSDAAKDVLGVAGGVNVTRKGRLVLIES